MTLTLLENQRLGVSVWPGDPQTVWKEAAERLKSLERQQLTRIQR